MGQRFDKVRGTTSSSFGIGNGRSGNKRLEAHTGVASPPVVQWNDSTNSWEFSEDGLRYFPIGSHFLPVTFAGMSDGLFGYFQSNDTAHRTDARYSATSKCCGAHVGVSGKLLTKGSVPAAQFSTASPTPTPGSPVYLARADDEPGNAAAGKLTAATPSTGIVAEVGLVVSVNPLTFPSSRVAHVLLQFKSPLNGVVGEVPSGAMNGVNKVFTTAGKFLERSLLVYLNGQRLVKGLSDDYTASESGGFGTGFDTITLALAPISVPRPDKLIIDYMES